MLIPTHQTGLPEPFGTQFQLERNGYTSIFVHIKFFYYYYLFKLQMGFYPVAVVV
jgi:hypothetical protein